MRARNSVMEAKRGGNFKKWEEACWLTTASHTVKQARNEGKTVFQLSSRWWPQDKSSSAFSRFLCFQWRTLIVTSSLYCFLSFRREIKLICTHSRIGEITPAATNRCKQVKKWASEDKRIPHTLIVIGPREPQLFLTLPWISRVVSFLTPCILIGGTGLDV